jgi:hypothetical protein
MEWIIARAKEPSTWRGIIALLALAGVSVNPDQVNAIVGAAVALVSAIEVFRKEPVKVNAAPKTGDADAEMQQAIQASGMANVAVPGMPDGV